MLRMTNSFILTYDCFASLAKTGAMTIMTVIIIGVRVLFTRGSF